jgi:hypothetical protein
MIFLVDHNLEGHALLLSGNIASLGWLDLLPIRFVTFEEIELITSRLFADPDIYPKPSDITHFVKCPICEMN